MLNSAASEVKRPLGRCFGDAPRASLFGPDQGGASKEPAAPATWQLSRESSETCTAQGALPSSSRGGHRRRRPSPRQPSTLRVGASPLISNFGKVRSRVRARGRPCEGGPLRRVVQPRGPRPSLPAAWVSPPPQAAASPHRPRPRSHATTRGCLAPGGGGGGVAGAPRRLGRRGRGVPPAPRSRKQLVP